MIKERRVYFKPEIKYDTGLNLGPGFFYCIIGPLPFSMACRKRRQKSDTNGCFPRN